MPPLDPIQVASLLGAALILIAFSASQLGLMAPITRSYNGLNFIGSGVLTWVALSTAQYGFLLLEGAWAAISLASLVRAFRRARRGRSNDPTTD